MEGQEICNDDDGEDNQIESSELAENAETKNLELDNNQDIDLDKETDGLNNQKTSSV